IPRHFRSIAIAGVVTNSHAPDETEEPAHGEVGCCIQIGNQHSRRLLRELCDGLDPTPWLEVRAGRDTCFRRAPGIPMGPTTSLPRAVSATGGLIAGGLVLSRWFVG